MEQTYIVNETSSDLRALARQALQGNWKLAVLTTLLLNLVMLMPALVVNTFFESGFAEDIIGLYSFLISAPLTLGFTMFTLNLFRRKPAAPTDIFYGFEQFFKALGVYIVMVLFTLLWTCLLIVPGIIAAYRYSLAFYILADHPEKSIMQCINESKQLMLGNKWKLFCLELSFIGWAVLLILTCGIATLWIAPYMNMASVAFYEIIIGNLKVEHRGLSDGNESTFTCVGAPISQSASKEDQEPDTAQEARPKPDTEAIKAESLVDKEEPPLS